MYSSIVTSKLCLFADNCNVYQGWVDSRGWTGTCRSVSYPTSGGPAPAGRVTAAESPVQQEPEVYVYAPAFSILSTVQCFPTTALPACLSGCLLLCAELRQTPYVLGLRIHPPSTHHPHFLFIPSPYLIPSIFFSILTQYLTIFTSLFSITFSGSNQSVVASGRLPGLCIIMFADSFLCPLFFSPLPAVLVQAVR